MMRVKRLMPLISGIAIGLAVAADCWAAGLRNPNNVVEIGATIFGMAVLLIVTFVLSRWRIRLDCEGILRRRLFWWDRWLWDDFARGGIRKLYGGTFLDQTRPWGRRTLRLADMPPKDFETVVAAINAHYVLPPPPELPPRMTIKCGKQTMTFDEKGIELLAGERCNAYLWSDVHRLESFREDAVRRDFYRLQLSLPDQEIDLMFVWGRHGEVKPNWKGATAEEVSEFLHKYVPAEKTVISFADEPPRDRVQIKREIRAIEPALPRYALRMFAVVVALIAGECWAIYERMVFVTVLGAFLLAGVSAVMIDTYRRKRSELLGLKERLAKLADEVR